MIAIPQENRKSEPTIGNSKQNNNNITIMEKSEDRFAYSPKGDSKNKSNFTDSVNE